MIGAASTIRGNVRGTGNLEVLGRVDGNIQVLGEVVLAEGCHVEGSVRATQLTVQGRVDGDLFGEQALQVQARAVITGELFSPRLSIEAGAELDGKVRTKAPVDNAPDLASASSSQKPDTSKRGEPEPEGQASLAKRDKAGKKKHKPPPEPVVPKLKKGAKGKKRKPSE